MHSNGDWAQVDLGPGNTGSHVEGWVEASTLNLNGHAAAANSQPITCLNQLGFRWSELPFLRDN
jgi:hypothetical protein